MKILKNESIEVRVQMDEKEAFRRAADLAGLPLSAWIRERLRTAARAELDTARVQIPFVQSLRERHK